MFRFTIRDVLWLTVIAGLALGWWVNRQHAETRHKADVAQLKRFRDTLYQARTKCAILDKMFRRSSFPIDWSVMNEQIDGRGPAELNYENDFGQLPPSN